MRKLASIQNVRNIRPISGADSIEMCNVLGWELVVKKGEFKDGDTCVYVEIDSILPDKPDFEFLRQRKFKVKTVKLRGQVSQGICFPLSILPVGKYEVGDDVTSIIGVTKNEQDSDDSSVVVSYKKRNFAYQLLSRFKWYRGVVNSKKGTFPSFIKKTDEDRIQLFPNICEKYNGVVFDITEKLDGQSGTFFIKENKGWLPWFKSYDIGVCSRNLRLVTPDYSTSYWNVFRKYNIGSCLSKIRKYTKSSLVVIQGEIIGPRIQKNKYKRSSYKFYVFNIILDGEPCGDNVIRTICAELSLNVVPSLGSISMLDSIPDMVKYSKGTSVVEDGVIREGIVVRNYDLGVSFKVINPDFLLKNDE